MLRLASNFHQMSSFQNVQGYSVIFQNLFRIFRSLCAGKSFWKFSKWSPGTCIFQLVHISIGFLAGQWRSWIKAVVKAANAHTHIFFISIFTVNHYLPRKKTSFWLFHQKVNFAHQLAPWIYAVNQNNNNNYDDDDKNEDNDGGDDDVLSHPPYSLFDSVDPKLVVAPHAELLKPNTEKINIILTICFSNSTKEFFGSILINKSFHMHCVWMINAYGNWLQWKHIIFIFQQRCADCSFWSINFIIVRYSSFIRQGRFLTTPGENWPIHHLVFLHH